MRFESWKKLGKIYEEIMDLSRAEQEAYLARNFSESEAASIAEILFEKNGHSKSLDEVIEILRSQ